MCQNIKRNPSATFKSSKSEVSEDDAISQPPKEVENSDIDVSLANGTIIEPIRSTYLENRRVINMFFKPILTNSLQTTTNRMDFKSS